METKNIAKRVTGLLVASSVALAGLALTGTAYAAQGNSAATITITAENDNTDPATYTAYLLGEYDGMVFDSATGYLKSLKIAALTNTTANDAIASDAQSVADDGVFVDTAIPMNWVAANWLGYATEPNMTDDTISAVSPYAGKLQLFAQALAENNNFTDNATSVDNEDYESTAITAGETIDFGTLKHGLYLIVDSSGESVPMIVGTKAYNETLDTYVDFEDGGEGVKPALGEAVLKNDDLPEIQKDILNDANGFSIGDKVQYEISFAVPAVKQNHTGAYTTTITDTAGDGLTLDDVRNLKIFAGTDPTELQNVAGLQISSSGQVLTITGLENLFVTGTSGDYDNIDAITVDGNVVDVSEGTLIYIRYVATVDADATSLDASEDPEDATDVSSTTNVAKLVTPTVEEGTDDTNEAIAYTFEIDLTKVDKDQPTDKLEGAEFTVARADAPETALKFAKISDGVFQLSQVGTDTVTSHSDGTFSVRGLEAGEYIFTETVAPDDHFAVNSFSVTISPNWVANEHVVETVEYDLDDSSADIWLSEVNTSTGISQKVYVGDPPANLINLPYTGGIGIAIFLVVGAAVTIIGIRAHRQSTKAENAAAAV